MYSTPDAARLARYDSAMNNKIARMRSSMDFPRYRANLSSIDPYGVYTPELSY